MWRSVLVCGVLLCAAPVSANPELHTIALFPLDADKQYAMYGQPVATELARSLTSANLKVVVVKQNMTVPTAAKLIVDGSIKAGKGDAITLTVRIREPRDGTVIDKLDSTAPDVGAIDRAASDLSSRMLPRVREQLDKKPPEHVVVDRPPQPHQPPVPDPTLLVAIGNAPDATAVIEPLRIALTEAVVGWTRDNRRLPSTVELSSLGRKLAPGTVETAKAERAVAFEIVDYWIENHEIPIARARVRVRIADASGVTFDRVVATDSVVGDKGIAPPVLAARVAREVLSILRPHMRRMEPKWR
jgi:hypothetical protein